MTFKDFCIKATVPSRIAISLYDMNGSLGRIDGGMGFSLQWPRLCFIAKRLDNHQIEIEGKRLDWETKDSLNSGLKIIQDAYQLGGMSLKINESIPIHSGFGSKTATLLSVTHVYAKLYSLDLDFRDLAVKLRRGGTSGVGINLIDKGGFILEGGHSTSEKRDFLPSSSVKRIIPAPVLARYKMPSWQVLICIPRLPRVYGQNEKKFFKKVCPINENDVLQLARITLSQALPSIVEEDLETFCNAINHIQKIGWKKSEIEIYKDKIISSMGFIQKLGALGTGMSSVGPCIYAFGENLDHIRKILLSKYSDLFQDVRLTQPCNKGMIMEVQQ